MSLSAWKYRHPKGGFTYLEEWMKFSIELANYAKQTPHPLKIYISVPSNLTFSYFFVLGAINYDFKNPPKDILDKYLNLQKGQRIL